MMMKKRHLAACGQLAKAKTCVRFAGLFIPLMMAGSAFAAASYKPVRVRPGTAKTHETLQPVKSSGKATSARDVEKRGAAAKTVAKGGKNLPTAPVRERRGHGVEPVVARHRGGVREVAQKTAANAAKASAARPTHVAAAEKHAGTPKKGLSVDDFARVAGPARRAETTFMNAPTAAAETHPANEIVASGESHPDPEEKLSVSDAEKTAAASAPMAGLAPTASPAPIVRTAPVAAPAAHAAPASRAVSGTASLSSVKHDEAVLAHDVAAIEADAKPIVVNIYSKTGKLLMPAPLKGSHDILVHQNQMADDAGLTRIQDDADLDRMRASHLLVGFPEMAGLDVNEDLPVNRRYARPWTVKFVADTARAYYAKFHEPLRLNSAVRTVDYQVKLRRVNGNAAAIDGEAASPHLTGQAIDFGKRDMSAPEIAWMRAYLLPLMQAGKLDVEEEFQQSCFHISVYGSYMPARHVAPKTEIAQLHNGSE